MNRFDSEDINIGEALKIATPADSPRGTFLPASRDVTAYVTIRRHARTNVSLAEAQTKAPVGGKRGRKYGDAVFFFFFREGALNLEHRRA